MRKSAWMVDAARDLAAVLQQLLDEKLVRIAPAAGATAPIEAPAEKKAYRKPALQIFRDMEELLALDPPAPGMNQIAWSARDAEAK